MKPTTIVQRFRGEMVPLASVGGQLQLGLALSVTLGGVGGETLDVLLRPEGEETFVTAAQVGRWLAEVGVGIEKKIANGASAIVLPGGHN